MHLEGRRTRYRLLETLRQYGINRLRESGEAAIARDAHLNWAVGLAEEAERHLDGLDQAAWLDRLECELDNLRAALEWAITSRNAEAGLRLASITIGGMWAWRGHVPEGQRWLQRLLATPAEVAAPARAKGLLAAGRVDFQAGQWTRGAQLCEQSCELFRATGDGAGEARALLWLAFNRWGTEDSQEIGDAFAAAIDVARRAERPLETGIALGFSGMWWSLRDLDRAQKLVEEAGQLIQRAESPNWLAHSYEIRALVAYLRGDVERARALIVERVADLPPDRQPRLQHALSGVDRGRGGCRGPARTSAQSCWARPSECASCSVWRPRPTSASCANAASAIVKAALEPDTAARAWSRGRELGFEDAMARAHALVRRPASVFPAHR